MEIWTILYVVIIVVIILMCTAIVVVYDRKFNNSNLTLYQELTNSEYYEYKTLNPKYYSGKLLTKVEARPHSVPCFVSFQLETPLGAKHSFGGILKDEYWIITAAHCLSDPTTFQQIIVVAGVHDIRMGSDSRTVQKGKIEKHYVHPLYDGQFSPYDIGLVKLVKPFKYTKCVQPATFSDVIPSATNYVKSYGFGNKSMTDELIFPYKLQEAEMPLILLSDCMDEFNDILKNSSSAFEIRLYSHQMCTSMVDLGACNGDSGGPLIQETVTEDGLKKSVVGLVSFGMRPCGNAPSVFVKISPFLPWIEETTKMMLMEID